MLSNDGNEVINSRELAHYIPYCERGHPVPKPSRKRGITDSPLIDSPISNSPPSNSPPPDSPPSDPEPPAKSAKSTPPETSAGASSVSACAESSPYKAAEASKPGDSSDEAQPAAAVQNSGSEEASPSEATPSVSSDATPSVTSDATPSVSSGESLPDAPDNLEENGVDIGRHFIGSSFKDRFAYGSAPLEGYVAWEVHVNAALSVYAAEFLLELCEVGFVSDEAMTLDDTEEIAGRDNPAFTVKIVATHQGKLLYMTTFGTTIMNETRDFVGNVAVKLGFVWRSSSKNATLYLVDENVVLWDKPLDGFTKSKIYPIFRLGKSAIYSHSLVTLELYCGRREVSRVFRAILIRCVAEADKKKKQGKVEKAETESNVSK